MMTSLLASLPEELVFEVMLYLDGPSILCMALTCRSCYAVFQSKPIRYIYELCMNDMQDTGSNRPPDELLDLLRDRQRAWAELDWKSTDVVRIQRNLGAYELVSGTFSRSDGNDLSVTYLPSARQPGHTIHRSSLDIDTRDFAIDASQDLIILLEDTVLPDVNRRISLYCRTISSNQVHPNATEGKLSFTIMNHPGFGNVLHDAEIQIADDVFAVHVCGRTHPRLLVWNWELGLLLFDSLIIALPDGFSDFDFLRRDSFILTSSTSSGLIHVYQFSPMVPAAPTRVASLELPRIAPLTTVSSLRVHSGQFQRHPTPGTLFMHSPDSRTHVFLVRYITPTNLHLSNPYSLFVRSSTFLHYVDGFQAATEPQEVPWEQWGEQESRFMRRGVSGEWLRYAHGNRVVCKPAGSSKIDVFDFSSGIPCPPSPIHNRYGRNNPTTLPCEDVFIQDVVTRLPFHASSKAMEHNPYAYMIDEERIVTFDFVPDGVELCVFSF